MPSGTTTPRMTRTASAATMTRTCGRRSTSQPGDRPEEQDSRDLGEDSPGHPDRRARQVHEKERESSELGDAPTWLTVPTVHNRR